MGVSSYTAIPPQQLKKNENQAREWRYLIIRRIADTHSYTNIALGHNGSDRVETLLAHGLRGAGLQGLNSLNWKRWIPIKFDFPIRITPTKVKRFYYKRRYYWTSSSMNTISSVGIMLVRPLLNLTRAEIRYEVNQKGYPLCIDPSNYYLGFQRNRIRHQLLPYLRKYFNPNIDSILRNLTEILEFEVLYIDSIVESLYQKSSTIHKEENESSFQFSLSFWRALPIAIQRRMLKKIVDVYGLSSLNFNQIENIRLDLNKPNHLSSRKLILSQGLVVKITSTKFMVKRNLDIL
jgi:tRNA(Ile)-lysidine synthase